MTHRALRAALWLTQGLLLHSGQAQTWLPMQTDVPTTAATWDPVRHRLLLCGAPRLFEWDGIAAHERLHELPDQRPIQHLLQDRAGRRILALANDRSVAAWEGGTWTWRNGGAPPPVDVATSVAWDSHRSRLVTLLAGTVVHEWDGVRWWMVQPTTATGPTAGCAFAFDPVLRRCIAYGGANSANAETWAFDGFAWTMLAAASPPGGRASAGLALDPTTGMLALYGGSATATDTWSWNGTAWLLRATTNDPGPQLRLHLLGEDNGLLLIATTGGDNGTIWRLRSGTWTRVGTLPVVPARRSAPYTWDPVREVAVSYGGTPTTTAPIEQTVLFARGHWPTHATVVPPVRAFGNTGWWSGGQRVLLFGGIVNTTAFSDTWTWNGSDWEARQPTRSPSPRHSVALGDDLGGGVLLFGGTDDVTTFGDQWHWLAGDWQPAAATALPPACAFATFIADPPHGEALLLGGVGPNVTDETWRWDGTGWLRVAGNTTPDAITAATVDPTNGRILALTTTASFHWTGSVWTSATLAGSGSTQYLSRVLVPDPRRGELWLLGPNYVALLGGWRADVATFGTGCANGQVPNLAAIDHPRVDTPFQLELTARAANAPALLGVGLTVHNSPLGSGCQAFVGTDAAVTFAVTDQDGIGRWPLAVPANAALRGVRLFAQAAVVDPPRSLLGSITTTAGLQLTIGW